MLGHGDGLLDKAFQVIGRREGSGVYHPELFVEPVCYHSATRIVTCESYFLSTRRLTRLGRGGVQNVGCKTWKL